MSENLVIVESPAKAKTIKKYLGPDFEVLASYGHVRDLIEKEGAVDPSQGFAMKYGLIDKNKPRVDAIARAVRSRGAVEPVFVESLDGLLPVLESLLEDGDLVLTMGAGDIGAYAAGLPELLQRKPDLKVQS